MQNQEAQKRFPWGSLVLTAVAVLGLVAIVYRFLYGLGASTNLSDGRAWGIWISFDLYIGVALAAGGFTLAAAVYIFAREKYHAVIRPAILTAFIGYTLVILALLVDLGQPWFIWKFILHPNIHSPLAEVGLCVMLYTIVLALEFSPVVFERLNWRVPMKWIRTIQIPLIVAGITLSTLHQSSLGGMALIFSETLDMLWYSPILPLLFLISAIAVGPAMVIVEGSLTSRAFGHQLGRDVLSGLGKVIPVILGIYLAFKIGDLVVTRQLGLIFSTSSYTILWWVEVLFGVVLPMILLSRPSVREHAWKLFGAAGLVVLGVMLNRFTISWFALEARPAVGYFPHWMEFAVSAGLVAWAVAIVMVCNKVLVMHEHAEPEHAEEPELEGKPGIMVEPGAAPGN